MSLKENIKQKSRLELEKLKQMSLKDKLWYIWEYYKFPIIGIVIAVIVATSIGTAIYNNRFDTAISCVILNSIQTDPEQDLADAYFQEGFRDYIGLDQNTVISIDTSLALNFDSGISSQYDYAALAKITALTASREMDVMIAAPSCIDHYGSMSAFMDLSSALPADLYDMIKDQLYYVTTEEGQEIACGVRLSDTTFGEKSGLSIKEPVFTILSNTAHIDNSIALLRYIVSQ